MVNAELLGRSICRAGLSAWFAGSCLVCFFALASLTGCGGDMSKVSGHVTLDGHPVAGGTEYYGQVLFTREDGSGAPAVAIVDGGGAYELLTGAHKGLEPGTYNVGVSVKKILPAINDVSLAGAEQLSAPRFASPKQSGFKAEVKPGSNTFDFAVQSK
jgi:hypothetical protein